MKPLQRFESGLPAIPEPIRPVPAIIDAEYEPSAAAVPLSHYLWILRRHGWRMLGFVAFAVIATLIVSLRLTPIYESTVTIDVDRRMPTGVLGQDATQALNNDADQYLATQIKLIQSDSVLRPVVDRYHLREVEKDAFEKSGDDSPMSLESPIILKPLRVTRPPNTYILQISYRSSNRQLAADVANAIAQSYLLHSYTIRYKATAGLSEFMERQLEELKAKMEKSSQAVQVFEQDLGVVNPDEKTNITAARLLQLNNEYTTAQGDRVRKQAAFEAVDDDSLAAAQVSIQGDALKKLGESLNEANEKFAEVRTHYGANHPEYRKAQVRVSEIEAQIEAARLNVVNRAREEFDESRNREGMLEKAVKETKAEFDGLNSRSFEYQTLKREAESDKGLYEELVRKIKEAGINASFQNNSIRVADLARPGLAPVFPKIWLNALLAFLLAALLAVGLAVASDVLDNTVRDPDQVARLMSTVVIGSLPAVKDWRRRATPALAGPTMATMHVKESTSGRGYQSLSTYEEAIRTLRNSILLTDFDRRLRSVLMTSASPSEGKSTVAAHLAATHAEQGKKTLLIDGDLRRPSVHRLYQVPNSVGLSNVLLQQIFWRDAVVRLSDPLGLDILPAGPSTRRASDLIGTGLAELIDEATREYDLVVLDAPPLLGFAEPLQMASIVDGVIIVARAGDTSRTALASVVQTLARLRANLLGVVLNEVHKEVSSKYYYSYYNRYGKYYSEPQPETSR
jgi:succinoglycan biosynthesis transport protein ExoP